ncbi:MAG: sugar phosphate isomerase/epimerase family protein [Planctomycetota bacterium]|jgi:sugar phosphate isomerase/epimerase|nr:sugar phosphate isomerase/epimerase family protein [Planctomycetota bacterium]MDP7253613.1 sugar phosphate isomerase/epimerase family protein [Planctomycetota bacterium]
MKDRLAFSTNAFSNENYTVDQAIHIIGECGYSGVEILFDKPHVWPLDLDASRVDELKTAVESSGMAISNINGNTASGFYGERNAPPGQTFGPGFSCTEEEFEEWGIDPAEYRVDYTKRCIDAAQQLGARNVSASSGFVGPGQDAARLWDQAVECFEECTEYAGNAGVYLIIEYEPDMLIGSAADCMRMIEAVGSKWLGVNYDIGHSYVVPGEDVFEAIGLLGDRIIGTHVEDIAGPTPELHIDPGHLIPGDGKMPLREIFEKLERANYKGFYTVELYTYARPGKDPMYAVTESLKRLMELAPD